MSCVLGFTCENNSQLHSRMYCQSIHCQLLDVPKIMAITFLAVVECPSFEFSLISLRKGDLANWPVSFEKPATKSVAETEFHLTK